TCRRGAWSTAAASSSPTTIGRPIPRMRGRTCAHRSASGSGRQTATIRSFPGLSPRTSRWPCRSQAGTSGSERRPLPANQSPAAHRRVQKMRYVYNALLIAGSLAISLMLGELALRWLHPELLEENLNAEGLPGDTLSDFLSEIRENKPQLV